MGVLLNPESDLAKEQARWERPYVFEPFPQMVFKAWPRENGRVECGDPLVAVGDPAAMTFTNRCQRVVRSADERQAALAQGWRDTPDEALAYYEALQQNIATAAAEVHAAVKTMSAKAQAEHKKKDAATAHHLPEG